MIGKTNAGGGINTKDATASANMIAYGQTAYVNGEKVTGTLGTEYTGYMTIPLPSTNRLYFEEESGKARRFRNYIVGSNLLYDEDTFTRAVTLDTSGVGYDLNDGYSYNGYKNVNNNEYLFYYCGGYGSKLTNGYRTVIKNLYYNRYSRDFTKTTVSGTNSFLSHMRTLSDESGAYFVGGRNASVNGTSIRYYTQTQFLLINNDLTTSISSPSGSTGHYISATRAGDRIFFAGGYNSSYESINSTSNPGEYCYNTCTCVDIATKTATALTPLSSFAHSKVSIGSNGDAIFAGGERDYYTASAYHNKVYIYDVESYSKDLVKTSLSNLSVPGTYLGAASKDNGEFIISSNNLIDKYDINRTKTTETVSLSDYYGLLTLNNKYYSQTNYIAYCKYVNIPQSYVKTVDLD